MPHTAVESIAHTETLIATLRRDAFILNSLLVPGGHHPAPPRPGRTRWLERSGTCILRPKERQPAMAAFQLVNLERQTFHGGYQRLRPVPIRVIRVPQ